MKIKSHHLSGAFKAAVSGLFTAASFSLAVLVSLAAIFADAPIVESTVLAFLGGVGTAYGANWFLYSVDEFRYG